MPLCLIVLLLLGCQKTEKNIKDNLAQEGKETKHDPSESWTLNVNNDAMRNTVSKTLIIESVNSAHFKFPYNGGSKLSLIVKDTNTDHPIVAFFIEKGQYDCDLYSCRGAIKFGSSDVEKVTFATMPTDGLLRFNGSNEAFVSNMRTIDKLIIELPFYQEGTKQFIFNLEGFSKAENKLK